MSFNQRVSVLFSMVYYRESDIDTFLCIGLSVVNVYLINVTLRLLKVKDLTVTTFS